MPAPVAITLGDPAGIGPEIVGKALADPAVPRHVRFEVLGELGPDGKAIPPGQSTPFSAQAALAALDQAIEGCLSGRYSAMVTGPVQKETIAQISPGFIGQTEYLARACGRPDADAVMVLTDPKLTVALCTQHCALREALDLLTSDRVVYVAQQTAAFLRRIGLASPRLALAGVNPHAGENGLFGDEEQRILAPALATLRSEGHHITGPHSPDTVFQRALAGNFDAVVCAYHDQGLIPFKLAAFTTGVNVTLGLPIIRTSPDHGTALDLAGKNVADHRSILAAIQLASRLANA